MANAVARRGTDGPGKAVFENARIIFRNFAGKEGQYNREGDRNFALIIDNSIAQQMLDEGWNIKYLRAREEGDEPQAYMQVAVSNKVRPPRIVMISERGRADVPWDLLEILDWVDIKNVDLIVNPYAWAVSGKTGIKAYLGSIYITIQEDELELKYADVPEVEGSATMLNYQNDRLALEAGDDPNIIDAEILED